MLLIMGVTLYTSRVVLNALGAEDYGIYMVVGGVVAMFTMISGALGSAISRFITVELGKENQDRLNVIFSTSIIIQIILAVVITLLSETFGMWFLLNKLVIPTDRLSAALWVFQFSLITLFINLISIPYNAAIIAHERMSAFAYISIIQAVGLLVIAYIISIAPTDKLVLYAVLMTSVAIMVRVAYGVYCRRHFEECRSRWSFDGRLLREMLSFAGWNFFGVASSLVRDQGGNILINILGGGAVANAARGISMQVSGAVVSFASNFMVALDPQITKSYAARDYNYMMSLIFNGSRYAFYMLLSLALPLIVAAPYILEMWLKNVPAYTVDFVRLALIFGICDALSRPLIIAILATGNIKMCQIAVGSIQIMNLPISFFALKMGYAPTSVLIVAITLILLCLVVRLLFLRGLIGLSIARYFRKVTLNILLVTAISTLSVLFAARYIPLNGFFGFALLSVISLLASSSTIYFLGCNISEREFICEKLSNVINKIAK